MTFFRLHQSLFQRWYWKNWSAHTDGDRCLPHRIQSTCLSAGSHPTHERPKTCNDPNSEVEIISVKYFLINFFLSVNTSLCVKPYHHVTRKERSNLCQSSANTSKSECSIILLTQGRKETLLDFIKLLCFVHLINLHTVIVTILNHHFQYFIMYFVKLQTRVFLN